MVLIFGALLPKPVPQMSRYNGSCSDQCAHIGSMTWTTGIPELDSALVMLSLCPKALVCSRNGSINVWGGKGTRNQWSKWQSSVGMHRVCGFPLVSKERCKTALLSQHSFLGSNTQHFKGMDREVCSGIY